jgi:hypothetical protein
LKSILPKINLTKIVLSNLGNIIRFLFFLKIILLRWIKIRKNRSDRK